MRAAGSAPCRVAGVAARTALVAALLAVPSAALPQGAPSAPARPRILIDQSPRAVEYQLRRLSNDELVILDRRPDDARYRLVYYALLTRTGLARQYRDEALGVLVALDRTSRPRVLLDALGLLQPTDDVAAERLIGVLLAEPIDALRQERDAFMRAASAAEATGVSRRGAYAAWMLMDGTARPAWTSASPYPERLVDVLRAVRSVVDGHGAPVVSSESAESIRALLGGVVDPVVRTAAVAALGSVRRDRVSIELLARELGADAPDAVRAAAVRSLLRMPLDAWTPDLAGAVTRTIVGALGNTPPSSRTEPAVVEAIELGERLAAVLPTDDARVLRRDLAALGVQVVRIETVPEQMRFTRKWFVVEAGKRVQIVLFNPDAMPHNVVVGRPGSLEQLGTAGSAMSMPTDPTVKPFVPDSPLVLAATKLVWEGETDRLNVTAPKVPGEYVFVCTYPGHWARMYGVMLVVENLEAWERDKTFPVDPLSNEVLR